MNQFYKIYTKNGYKCIDYQQLKEAIVIISQVIAKENKIIISVVTKTRNQK